MSARCLTLFACEALFRTAAIMRTMAVAPGADFEAPVLLCVRAPGQGDGRPALLLTERGAVKQII